MRKTTIVILPQHQAAYEAFRRERPQLTLTQFYSECVTFRLHHGDEASLRPTIKAQQELIQKLEATMRLLSNPPPAIDHTRLELHTKRLAEQVSTSMQHLAHGVQTAAGQAIAGYRRIFWQVALGAFTIGAVVGAGGLWLSKILG